MMQNFITGLGQFVGVFLGVVAGVCITLAVDFFKARNTWKRELDNLRFELKVNVAKVDDWLEEMTRWRNAVNGDSLAQYHGYFKFSSVISVTTNSLFNAGKLYSALNKDHIAKLQEVFNDFSTFGEQYMNNQITQKKQSLAEQADRWVVLKPECIRDIDFWERKLKSHRAALVEVDKAVAEKVGN